MYCFWVKLIIAETNVLIKLHFKRVCYVNVIERVSPIFSELTNTVTSSGPDGSEPPSAEGEGRWGFFSRLVFGSVSLV